jgi:pyruvate/2-oxoglutarate dehydrogenase complex dihydrolipoamide acyltransferase (E2) component
MNNKFLKLLSLTLSVLAVSAVAVRAEEAKPAKAAPATEPAKKEDKKAAPSQEAAPAAPAKKEDKRTPRSPSPPRSNHFWFLSHRDESPDSSLFVFRGSEAQLGTHEGREVVMHHDPAGVGEIEVGGLERLATAHRAGAH